MRNSLALITLKLISLCLTFVICNTGVSNAELLVNGDFKQGMVGFSSDFLYRSDTSKDIPGYLDGEEFTVTDDNFKIHHLTDHLQDHTTGAGKMLSFNGAINSPLTIWSQTVNLDPNQSYEFTFWTARWLLTEFRSEEQDPRAQMRVRVN